MRNFVTLALAGGFVAALSVTASAQSMDYGPAPVSPDQEVIVQPDGAIVAQPDILLPGETTAGPVRIIQLDALLAEQEQNKDGQSGLQMQAQAEVSSDPMLLEALASAGLSAADVVAVGTDIDGQTTIYVRS